MYDSIDFNVLENKIDYLEVTCKLICINFKAMLSIETRTILEKEPGTRTDNEVHMVSRKQNYQKLQNYLSRDKTKHGVS